MKKTFLKKWQSGLITLAIIGSACAGFLSVVHAQLVPNITVNLPFMNSPYVLDTAGIAENTANSTWNLDYAVPPNTYSSNFKLEINGVSAGNGQILNGELIFRVPNSAFGVGGSALVTLMNQTTGQIVATNVVLVLAQAIQPPKYVFNPASVTQNQNQSWNIGYSVPPNTNSSHLALSIGSNAPLTGSYVTGGVLFRVPSSVFVSGSTLALTLKDTTTGTTLASNTVMVPQSGPSPYVLDTSSIKQNQNGTWNVAYSVPQGTIGPDFSVTPGTGAAVTDGEYVSGKLVFEIPQTELTSGSQAILKFSNLTTGQVYSTDTITVPAGIPPQYVLQTSLIAQNADGSWKIIYTIPPNTQGDDFVLQIGTKGQVGNGILVNNDLVFTVPGNLYTAADQSTLLLQNIVNGMLYHADGTVTQGTVPASTGTQNLQDVGGLIITFPAAKEDIKMTSATIVANFHADIALPTVDVSYVWNKDGGDPASDTTTSLLKIPSPGMKTDTDKTANLTFSNLTANTVYHFVLKNNVTNSVSDVIKFTTPATANGKSYISYGSGLVNYSPSGSVGSGLSSTPAVVDDISDKGIVPLCGRTPGSSDDITQAQFQPCGYKDFLQLISNVMRYALIILGPLVAILAIYYGFIIIWTGKIPDPTAEQMAMLRSAKAGLVKIAIGLLIILSGWVLINTITSELGVKSNYTLLDVFNGK